MLIGILNLDDDDATTVAITTNYDERAEVIVDFDCETTGLELSVFEAQALVASLGRAIDEVTRHTNGGVECDE